MLWSRPGPCSSVRDSSVFLHEVWLVLFSRARFFTLLVLEIRMGRSLWGSPRPGQELLFVVLGRLHPESMLSTIMFPLVSVLSEKSSSVVLQHQLISGRDVLLNRRQQPSPVVISAYSKLGPNVFSIQEPNIHIKINQVQG